MLTYLQFLSSLPYMPAAHVADLQQRAAHQLYQEGKLRLMDKDECQRLSEQWTGTSNK